MASMDTAPRTGEVIEALFDGEWMEVYWGHTDDGSSYGTEGWGQVDGGYFIDTHPAQEIEAWRPLNAVSYGAPSGIYGHRGRQPIVVLGLGFGDESKGATVDYLSQIIPDAVAVVRWSGGANAAHNVRHGGRHHTFRQFGSGSFLGLSTILSERVVVNLQILMAEAVELEEQGLPNPLSLMRIHSDALVTTPIHMALNRAREILRGSGRHGSCGLGIGETIVHGYAEDHRVYETETVGNFEVAGPTAEGQGKLTVGMLSADTPGDLRSRVIGILEHQAAYAQPLIKEASAAVPLLAAELQYGELAAIADELIAVAQSVKIVPQESFDSELKEIMAMGTVIFEGSQGVLLDEKWGFHPHTTWAQTEPSALNDYLLELGHRPYIIGLTRSYTTRHGAGPLPSQGAVELTESMLPSDDNSWGRWQGEFRVAPLDLPLLSYSRRVLRELGLQLDGLSVSHLDGFEGDLIPAVSHYGAQRDPSSRWHFRESDDPDFPTMDSDRFIEESVISRDRTVLYLTERTLFEELSARLEAPVVLTARGPNRTDRSLGLPSFPSTASARR